MRIIAGQYRSRVLLPPENVDTTRPITDRVKQSLFDILTPLLDENAIVLDCFAGTGSMGLESLSRGAKHAFFFEIDRSALSRLKKNIQTLGVAAQSTIISTDLFKYFAASSCFMSSLSAVIFLDPPYRFLRERGPQLQTLAGQLAHHLAPDGLIIFRHDAQDRCPLPGLVSVDSREYGGMTLEFLRKAGALGGGDNETMGQ